MIKIKPLLPADFEDADPDLRIGLSIDILDWSVNFYLLRSPHFGWSYTDDCHGCFTIGYIHVWWYNLAKLIHRVFSKMRRERQQNLHELARRHVETPDSRE